MKIVFSPDDWNILYGFRYRDNDEGARVRIAINKTDSTVGALPEAVQPGDEIEVFPYVTDVVRIAKARHKA